MPYLRYVSKVFPLLVIFGTECQVAEETVRLSEPSCSVVQQSSLRYVGGRGGEQIRESALELDQCHR